MMVWQSDVRAGDLCLRVSYNDQFAPGVCYIYLTSPFESRFWTTAVVVDCSLEGSHHQDVTHGRLASLRPQAEPVCMQLMMMIGLFEACNVSQLVGCRSFPFSVAWTFIRWNCESSTINDHVFGVSCRRMCTTSSAGQDNELPTTSYTCAFIRNHEKKFLPISQLFFAIKDILSPYFNGRQRLILLERSGAQ